MWKLIERELEDAFNRTEILKILMERLIECYKSEQPIHVAKYEEILKEVEAASGSLQIALQEYSSNK